MNSTQAEAFKSILAKIEAQYGEEGVIKFLDGQGKEVPAIKLTQSEMDMLKAGCWNAYDMIDAARRAYKRDGLVGVAVSLADSILPG